MIFPKKLCEYLNIVIHTHVGNNLKEETFEGNLALDKSKVFHEAYRVLRKNGRIYVSDIVLLEELDPAQRSNKDLLSGCMAGALLKDDYLKAIEKSGFDVEVLSEDKGISERQYRNIALESIKLKALRKD